MPLLNHYKIFEKIKNEKKNSKKENYGNNLHLKNIKRFNMISLIFLKLVFSVLKIYEDTFIFLNFFLS